MAKRVLGVLGGDDVDDGTLASWASSADVVYGADSGADRLIALGFEPIVVGDFDSFASLASSSHLRLVKTEGEDTTDCDKLLRLVEQDGHTSITLTCVEGDLPDHVLATYSSAVACGLDVRFAFRRGIGRLVRTRSEATTRPGQRVSLLPLTPCTGVKLEGVKWEVSGSNLTMGGAVSVSNEATGGLVRATLQSGCALLFVETDEVAW